MSMTGADTASLLYPTDAPRAHSLRLPASRAARHAQADSNNRTDAPIEPYPRIRSGSARDSDHVPSAGLLHAVSSDVRLLTRETARPPGTNALGQGPVSNAVPRSITFLETATASHRRRMPNYGIAESAAVVLVRPRGLPGTVEAERV